MSSILSKLGDGVVNGFKGLLVLGITMVVMFPLIHGIHWLEHRFVHPRPEFAKRSAGAANAAQLTGVNTAELQRKANELRGLIATFQESARFNRVMAMQWAAESGRPGQGPYNEQAKVAECHADATRADQQANQYAAQLQAIETELARRR